MPLKISKKADEDLNNLYEYGYLNYGEEKADEYYDRIIHTFNIILENPSIAPLRYELIPPARCIPVNSHLIIYDVNDNNIEIISVPHASSNWGNQLQ